MTLNRLFVFSLVVFCFTSICAQAQETELIQMSVNGKAVQHGETVTLYPGEIRVASRFDESIPIKSLLIQEIGLEYRIVEKSAYAEDLAITIERSYHFEPGTYYISSVLLGQEPVKFDYRVVKVVILPLPAEEITIIPTNEDTVIDVGDNFAEIGQFKVFLPEGQTLHHISMQNQGNLDLQTEVENIALFGGGRQISLERGVVVSSPKRALFALDPEAIQEILSESREFTVSVRADVIGGRDKWCQLAVDFVNGEAFLARPLLAMYSIAAEVTILPDEGTYTTRIAHPGDENVVLTSGAFDTPEAITAQAWRVYLEEMTGQQFATENLYAVINGTRVKANPRADARGVYIQICPISLPAGRTSFQLVADIATYCNLGEISFLLRSVDLIEPRWSDGGLISPVELVGSIRTGILIQ